MYTKFPLILCLMLHWSSSVAQTVYVSADKFSLMREGHTLKIPVYANADLYETNLSFDKAIVVIHGTNRNADDYFVNMQTAANQVPNLSTNTLIVAPQFLTESDVEQNDLDDEHLYWTSGGWKAGSNSRNEDANPRPVRIPSYAVLDSLLMHLVRLFPNIEMITLTGHSAGGQGVQRMAATSPLAESLCTDFGVSIRFVVANPSSYVYMDGQRRRPGTLDDFSLPNTSCGSYNEWKYGLEDLYTYPELSGVDSIRARFKRRQVTYLLGEQDNNPDASSLDESCPANLQGDHRLERGIIYYHYLQHYYGSTITDNHSISLVPNVGHSNFAMYNSSQGLAALFNQTGQACGSLVTTEDSSEPLGVKVFPNPAQNQLYLSGIDRWNQPVSAKLFDLFGRQIWTGKVSAREPIDIRALSTGLYLLLIEVAGTELREKIVIK